jgi:hypothetical protein
LSSNWLLFMMLERSTFSLGALLNSFSYFLGGYASNGASAQGFQSDGDSNNTTVSFPASLCSFNLLETYVFLLNRPCVFVDICWRAWPQRHWWRSQAAFLTVWWDSVR